MSKIVKALTENDRIGSKIIIVIIDNEYAKRLTITEARQLQIN